MSDRLRTSDDAARAVFDLLRKGKKPKPSFIGSSSSSDDETERVFDNPMTTLGDIIYGGEAGAPRRRGIGTNGQVLAVVSGVPQWSSAASGFDPDSILTDLDGNILVDLDGNVIVDGGF